MNQWNRLDETEALPARRLHRPPVTLVFGNPCVPDLPALRLVSLTGGPIIEIRQRQLVIGRHSSADVQILEPDISRRHCRLFHADGEWHVEDLGSLNGTQVNGEPIIEVALRPSDMLHIGAQRFRVETEPVPAPAAGQPEPGRSEQVLRSIARLLAEDDGDRVGQGLAA